MAHAYVIGIDFGTLSARAVLVNARNGEELASAVSEYRSGVIEEKLPGKKTRLKAKSALQDPADYIAALEEVVRVVLRKARVRPERVVALGTDFTSCTVLPVKSDGSPLSYDQRHRKNPHAWVKLWKHHATQPEADDINTFGAARGEEFMRAYGGRYSSEWFFSKVLETIREAPEIYKAADFFIEAGDWIVWQLSGKQTRNLSAAGFKGMRVHRAAGGWSYPEREFFAQLDRGLKDVVQEKLGGPVIPPGSSAGGLSDEMARRLKLPVGIPIAAGNIDAHAGVPACGVTRPGTLAMIMGTSTCHLLMADRRVEAEGICGVVEDGVVPGYWGYEAGQSGVGDLFAWYVTHACPSRDNSASTHEKLSKEAGRLRPGQSGLLALDWWNGNRSILVNAELTGLLLGLTIHTRPLEIYRALIEATAFGTRKIVEAFTSKGVPIKRIVASGGLAQKNEVLMQIYADVLQRRIEIAAAEQTSALGAAMWASVAGGVHRDIHAAAKKMVRPPRAIFRPNLRHRKIYNALYAEYSRLHDQFGREPTSSMRVLREIQKQS
ncbi:MAG: ribulokinase [Limisphaerales bacterium]